MFVIKRIATLVAIVIATVLLLEHGCGLGTGSSRLVAALLWIGRLALIAAAVWVWLAFRGASSATASFSGGEVGAADCDLDELC